MKMSGRCDGPTTETVERRCDGLVSVEAFEIFIRREMRRVAKMFLRKTSWTTLRTCPTVRLNLVRMSVWCVV